jgi:hypothetical protein
MNAKDNENMGLWGKGHNSIVAHYHNSHRIT